MGVSNTFKARATRSATLAYAAFPFPQIKNPIFIIGCGRSGTTILGTALSEHRRITYLNEPRHLWFFAYPETDIWTHRAGLRNGRMCLSASDAVSGKSKRLRRLFHLQTVLTGRPILVEKLPINNFRLEFIKRIFPDGRYVHLYRNGLEVARSIEKLCANGQWFGANSYKWDRIVEYAKRSNNTNDLPSLCTTDFDKGLLEWRLSTEVVTKFLANLPSNAFLEVSYAQFLADPARTISDILRFIGISKDTRVTDFVTDRVARRSAVLSLDDVSDKCQALGGELLPMSITTMVD